MKCGQWQRDCHTSVGSSDIERSRKSIDPVDTKDTKDTKEISRKKENWALDRFEYDDLTL